MKKLFTIISLILVMILLTACNDYTVDFGESEIYTHEDMNSAVNVIKRDFFSIFSKQKLISLTYMGDEFCSEELSYCNELKDNKDTEYTQCIVFESSWINTARNSPVFEHNEIVTSYQFYLARLDDGKWELVMQGHP